MKRLVLSLCLVLFSASVAHAAPITVMRFSGAITSVASDFTNFLPEGMDVGTWFVGSLWIDDESFGRYVNFDITIGKHHITSYSLNGWTNEDADYQSMYGNWSALRGGYVDPIILWGASGPFPRQLFVYVVGPGIVSSERSTTSPNQARCSSWLQGASSCS